MMLALDLEASLIDNAISGAARPGLRTFIEYCMETFERVALLTTVEESDAREVLYALADAGHVPEAFASVEYIDWQGEFKDLRYVNDSNPSDILFLDDDKNWVHPEQMAQWIAIKPWLGDTDDIELSRVQKAISDRLG